MDWCVTFPKESVLIWRPSLRKACGGNRNAAKFLTYLLYRASVREEAKIEAQNINEVRKSQGLTPDQDTTITIYRTQRKIYDEMDGELSDRTLRDDAIPCLMELGFLTYIEYKGNKNYTAYTIYPDAIQRGIDHPEKIPNHTTLKYYERLQVNRKKFRTEIIPHDSEIIPNRSGNSSDLLGNVSERQRGRKPKPEAPGEPQSEEPQISIEINTKIGNKEESIATSLREDRAPAPIDFSEEKKKRTDPKLPAVSSHSQVDRGNEDFDTDAHEREVIEAFLNADTVKVAAIPKQTPGAGTRALAADPPVGSQDDSASVQAPIVSPSSVDAAQRTVTPQAGVGAASQDGAVQASGKRTRTRKEVTQATDEPVPMPKSDSREIQRRINEHRGYALEEKVDIVRERQAIKTWCNLHTLEEYGLVMAGAKKDKYWGKQENYYRIGGLTLLKITPEILARQRQPLQLVANGHNGHHSDLVEWQGRLMTVEEADELGYNGGFGLYK